MMLSGAINLEEAGVKATELFGGVVSLSNVVVEYHESVTRRNEC